MPTQTDSPSTALTPTTQPKPGGLMARLTSSLDHWSPDERKLATRGAASIAGGAVGAYLWGSHRVLGFFTGAALAGAATGLAQGMGTREAVERVLPAATAVGGSLLWKRHPVLGFIGGGVVGAVASETVLDRLMKRFG